MGEEAIVLKSGYTVLGISMWYKDICIKTLKMILFWHLVTIFHLVILYLYSGQRLKFE